MSTCYQRQRAVFWDMIPHIRGAVHPVSILEEHLCASNYAG